MNRIINFLDRLSQRQVNVIMSILSGLVLLAVLVTFGGDALDGWWHQQYEWPMESLKD